MLYYEDIQINVVQKYGSYEVTREEVIEFASKYDPQPFHLDDEAAAKTHFGRLSASGWHSAAMMMRMMVDQMTANKQAGLGSPGVENLRWLKPVYPGDTLRCEHVTLEKRQSESRPEMGIMKGKITVLNQHDEPVMTMESTGLIEVRGD
ncbi:MaoC family dehydratase [Parasphingorhabdus litoris]|uniref:MaoC family dehydratase n=1 Tax=Parasphingorhabdus litoris TaxID=394733 RepID=A0ABN1ATK6_9SPHN|nr:MaoC family dehydratase [Parasphingorhabdus litoris]